MKRFQQLAWPYIVWAVMMLVLPMALIALYSVMNQGNSIISFLVHTGTLCQIFYRSGFLINPLAFHTDCGEDNRFMSASRLSDRILYSKKHRKSTEYIDFMHYTADVDQHACANIRMDRTSEQRWYFSENTWIFRTWKCRVSLCRGRRTARYGI